MPISIQRGRQFLGDAAGPLPLFEADGRLGGYLPAAAKKLADQEIAVRLVDAGANTEHVLRTADDWARFFEAHAPNHAATKGWNDKFGISFRGFVNVLDDVAMSDDRGILVDLEQASPLAVGLSLASDKDSYALKLPKGAAIDLTGPVASKANHVGAAAIGPDILAKPIKADWQRDRTEQESWADFKTGNGAQRIFRDNTGPAPFVKLHEPKWNDAEAMAVATQFHMPIHLEIDADVRVEPGKLPEFQDRSEMFREIYLKDPDGVMDALKASVRVRIRFDKKKPDPNDPNAAEEFEVRRVLVQAKEGREVDRQTGRSAVRKFEKRWDGANAKTEEAAMQALVTGYDNGEILNVSAKLYQLAKDEGVLPEDGMLRLQPNVLVLQKRRRTHLQLDSLATVTARRDAVKKEHDALVAANQPVDPALKTWLDKLDQQVASMTAMGATLKKYNQWMPSGECMIVSADRYNVYDPAARAKMPFDLDDTQGRIGSGLHIEAEWDTQSSDPFEKAQAEITKRLAANPANKAELEADLAAIEGYREVFRQDVAKTVEVMKQRLLDAGMKLDPDKKSKEERASQFLANRAERPFYWLG
ncbi:hypothetical protein L6R52_02765 [Myxococcota bacterium]|nr:hypothetical protein [Myxococcota bacterium]